MTIAPTSAPSASRFCRWRATVISPGSRATAGSSLGRTRAQLTPELPIARSRRTSSWRCHCAAASAVAGAPVGRSSVVGTPIAARQTAMSPTSWGCSLTSRRQPHPPARDGGRRPKWLWRGRHRQVRPPGLRGLASTGPRTGSSSTCAGMPRSHGSGPVARSPVGRCSRWSSSAAGSHTVSSSPMLAACRSNAIGSWPSAAMPRRSARSVSHAGYSPSHGTT